MAAAVDRNRRPSSGRAALRIDRRDDQPSVEVEEGGARVRRRGRIPVERDSNRSAEGAGEVRGRSGRIAGRTAAGPTRGVTHSVPLN